MLEEIDPDCNVIFIFEEGMKKLQVHSFLLKRTSPIFAVILEGTFKEGQMLQEAALENIWKPRQASRSVEDTGGVYKAQPCQILLPSVHMSMEDLEKIFDEKLQPILDLLHAINKKLDDIANHVAAPKTPPKEICIRSQD
ncbi:hypothetical protein FGADI_802 [Fusarium gaditjirri]|uniref:BTB domain-containing protein n=1 Tax=Fusarium gaditjirri TaxID=282569 RepID=A0A8H4X3L0_9HYPO|nr:hypothetical protein FGADI_802 [Fusarium gaditjirri]